MLHNYDNNKVTSHLRIGRTINVSKEIENLFEELGWREAKAFVVWIKARKFTPEEFEIRRFPS